MPFAAALAEAERQSFWLAGAPEPTEPLTGDSSTDLAVVGGGYSGLWTALLAKEREPTRDVVLLEARAVGWAASGRNGGFCDASLTHGLSNGLNHFPDEIETLVRLGRENLDAIEATVRRYRIDCDFRRSGAMNVATAGWQLRELKQERALAERLGHKADLLDADATRAEVRSPTYLGGLWDRDGCAIVDPARLAWGLREACRRLGVRVHENTPVRRLTGERGRVVLHTSHGRLDAARVALGTGAHGTLLPRLRRYVVPVYDYALMTEPLSTAQLEAIGWRNRQGLADCGNQFHYYRMTADDRILWGGYDAVYYRGGCITDERNQNSRTHELLAGQFFETFPQLEGLRFSHRWGGVIDTCSRFCAFFGTAMGGRVAYAVGYTGLGVGATRFGANVMLDLLAGEPTELTRLKMVRSRPIPFPPEPMRSAVIGLTRWSIGRADAHEGRRNLWLRLLDRLGAGYDS